MKKPLHINMGVSLALVEDLSLLEGNTPILMNRGLLIPGSTLSIGPSSFQTVAQIQVPTM